MNWSNSAVKSFKFVNLVAHFCDLANLTAQWFSDYVSLAAGTRRDIVSRYRHLWDVVDIQLTLEHSTDGTGESINSGDRYSQTYVTIRDRGSHLKMKSDTYGKTSLNGSFVC